MNTPTITTVAKELLASPHAPKHPDSRRSLAAHVRQFIGWLNRDLPIAELTPELLNEFIANLETWGISERTLRNYRGHINCIWRFAHKQGYCQTRPKRNPPSQPSLYRVPSPRTAANGVGPFPTSVIANLPAVVSVFTDARDVGTRREKHLSLSAKEFSQWLAKRERTHGYETDSQRVSAWLAELAPNYSPVTVNNRRECIIALSRFATPDGQPLIRVDRIRRQREPEKIKPAFTRDEIRQMIECASDYTPMAQRVWGQGRCRVAVPRVRSDGVAWSTFWLAFVRVGYDSGQYLRDLRRIPWSSVRSDGIVTFVRKKTGKRISFRLSQAAINAAKAIDDPELLLPWPYDIEAHFQREWKKFVKFADVRELGAKSLRRSAITYTYMEYGEEAARLLAGHSSFATTAKHYIDWSLATLPVASPPAIEIARELQRPELGGVA